MQELPVNECRRCHEKISDFKTQDNILNSVFNLSPRDYEVIIKRFALDLTLQEVAKSFRVTKERVKQIEIKAIRRILLKLNHQSDLKITPHDIANTLKDNLDSIPNIERESVTIQYKYKE